ncbi:3-hydroxyacyl-CoA dehydrogenase NAD-binding domain-containing protein [Pelagibius sp. Alg239-R121]|uniref:3-hydroxyacyl-CoA dehydrogenase NAD-binding domain-containing protein n=1 Tax=Pelagibius sp. Alg239-R121 TaxID=2993448 RepID=UPI0024A68400|nr:3-hydroxyacyl-CoA dehydrogenase NAD-binding domain-containing protein [Pelagibius sp. Alg239-R121]
MQQFERVAVLGAGVIGVSWTALFLARGLAVDVYDPAEDAEKQVGDYVARAWPLLEKLGLAEGADPNRLRFHTAAGTAVQGAQFVQENVPERLEIKHALFREIEPHLPPEAIVASSASGLMVHDMQKGWQDPSRFLLGHPFNPPHLIPLVELITNEQTADGVLERAEQFYEEMGKETIRVKREVPGHVANRLQAALWREAIHLVASGVASVEDVDKAVWAGPGLRWAAMGPHMLFHLGAGSGGMAEFCNRYRDSFHRWWEDLGTPELTQEIAAILAEGIAAETGQGDVISASSQRDAMILAMLQATRDLRTR